MTRGPELPLAALLLALFLAAPAIAGPWAGTETKIDGVPHIQNPATPSQGESTLDLEELWRLGGDSGADEEFFGVIGAVAAGPDGNLYLLDRQLSEVRVFTPDGDYVRTIGREGEGPGEFRSPSDLFFTPDGKVGVLQTRPGKIVLLTPEGDPAGDLPVGSNEGFSMLMGGESAGDHMVLAMATMRRDTGKMVRTSSLAAYDPSGKAAPTYFSEETDLNFAKPVVDERKGMTPPWTLGPDGTVYLVPDFGEYRIRVVSPDGTVSRVIERPFEHLPRTAAEKEAVKKRFVIRGPFEPEIVVSEHEPDVNQMFPREDGSLWVLTSRGARPTEARNLATIDVFDPAGRFTRQVTLRGEGDAEDDALFFVGDRVFVVTQFRSALQSMFGAGEEGATDEADPKPMEVICYRMPGLGPVKS